MNDPHVKHELDRIKEGDRTYLRQLYEQYRNPFVNWLIRNHQCTQEDAREIYQKAFIALYLNIRNEKVASLQSSVDTYLFGIGKNIYKKMLRDKQKQSYLHINGEEEDGASFFDYFDPEVKEADNERKEVVNKALTELGDPCKSVLTMIYFDRFSMESVACRMGYKNEVVARKKKFFCLKYLREIVDKMKKNCLYEI